MKIINLTMVNSKDMISINAEAIVAIEKKTDSDASIVYLSKDFFFVVEESVEEITNMIK